MDAKTKEPNYWLHRIKGGDYALPLFEENI